LWEVLKMVSSVEARELPEWIDLGALATPEEIATREMLVARGAELFPALATWIKDAAPLAERPPLLEVVDETREVIYSRMGITALVEAVDQFRQLVAVFEASGSELDHRVNEIPVVDRVETPVDVVGRDGEVHAPDLDAETHRVGVAAERERTGRWRNRP
jgi:hypothetical protein